MLHVAVSSNQSQLQIVSNVDKISASSLDTYYDRHGGQLENVGVGFNVAGWTLVRSQIGMESGPVVAGNKSC